ncbi:hypothetical protein DSM101010T_03780 [Desulfovibrio subterraneus]|uniref:Uncharacterized protein n=1 Tax=Desulfovibrio subterraneus TaxID=2718620 RepID=A0A7J0BE69_9BACT|nr:hypothetical protein DSM101010T_03780 [Desulfovibrio subterraneus]
MIDETEYEFPMFAPLKRLCRLEALRFHGKTESPVAPSGARQGESRGGLAEGRHAPAEAPLWSRGSFSRWRVFEPYG